MEQEERYVTSELSAGEWRGLCVNEGDVASTWPGPVGGTCHTEWWKYRVSVSMPMKSICPVGEADRDRFGNTMVDVTMKEECVRLT